MPEEKEEKKELEVTILDRATVTTYPTLEKAVKVKTITFTAPDVPPLTVRIPEEEYSEELEDKKIRKAIREYKKKKPEVKKITI